MYKSKDKESTVYKKRSKRVRRPESRELTKYKASQRSRYIERIQRKVKVSSLEEKKENKRKETQGR
jgi:hypothetical protein